MTPNPTKILFQQTMYNKLREIADVVILTYYRLTSEYKAIDRKNK